jgi:hypothetical protein
MEGPEVPRESGGLGAFVFPALDDPQDRRRTRAWERARNRLQREAFEPGPHVSDVEVPVDLRGEFRSRVAQDALDHGQRDALPEQQGCGGVPEVGPLRAMSLAARRQRASVRRPVAGRARGLRTAVSVFEGSWDSAVARARNATSVKQRFIEFLGGTKASRGPSLEGAAYPLGTAKRGSRAFG